MKVKRFLIFLLIITMGLTCQAWIYPEHRDLSLMAIQKLDPGRRASLDQLWATARKGHELRLTEFVADFDQGEKPTHLDWASWAAIGGDHSVSPANLLHNVLETDWILKVANIAAHLKYGLATADNRSERINRIRESDIRLLRADPEYVSRAGANYGHFMLALPEVNTSAESYFDSCFKAGSPLNLVGNYKWFHASALLMAQRMQDESLTPGQRSKFALAALANEAFALHFLNDGYASGHVAGIWGDASQRKGTHDYYNEMGLEVNNWKGERLVLIGDGYMRQEDAERVSDAVLLSLEQFLDAYNGKMGRLLVDDRPDLQTADTFDVGKGMYLPARSMDTAFIALYYKILIDTPVPGLASGLGEIPRFRSEIGPFIGLAASARASVVSSGFEASQQTAGFVPGLGLAIRIGLGMDGVLNESGDGLAFLDLGWRLDGASSMKFYNEPDLKYFGSILSAIPSRDGYFARLRLPFYLIPGDLIIVGPFLYLFAPDSFNKMVATAGNGGLIPWQTGLVTPLGRFQFILGREVGACWYGVDKGGDAMLVPDNSTGVEGDALLISMYSLQLDFPVLEYRPFRTFSARQSADLVIQLNAGVDFPMKTTVVSEGANPPQMKTTWFVGLRMVFDWRYYFSKSTKKSKS